MNDIKTIQNLILGRTFSKNTNTVLIIPFKSFYNNLLELLKKKFEVESYKGFYRNFTVKSKSKTITVINTPQGSLIRDVLFSLSNTSHIYFFGYCGALNSNLNYCDTVLFKSDKEKHIVYSESLLKNIKSFKEVKFKTVLSLLGYSELDYKKMLLNDYDVVDMESNHIYDFIHNSGITASIICLVSDSVFTKKFYKIKKNELSSLYQKTMEILLKIVSLELL